MGTFADFLVNEQLPNEFKIKGTVTKSALKDSLTRFAKSGDPRFTSAVSNIKAVGDDIATFDGLSVGLDDISPQYKERNSLIDWATKGLKGEKNKKLIQEKLLEIQDKAKNLAMTHQGTFGTMVRSGGRGNANQLMKSVVSPVVVKDNAGQPYPYLIRHSYSEGLSPAEYWIAGNEARQEVIRGQLSTATPGDMGKQISATLNGVSITRPDCGTRNGIPMRVDDPQAVDRYLAKDAHGLTRNTLVTSGILRDLSRKKVREIIVRSPMTCEESPGICQKCYGLNEKGRDQSLGTHVGLRSAQALAEPLTQMVLSSKHGVVLAKGEEDIGSVEGVRQLLEIPGSFKLEAEVAKVSGKIERITSAPQGGKYLYIQGVEHYANPKQNINVKVGDAVEKGDALTSGVINPKDIIRHKGLGEGRKYLADRIYGLYKNDGIDIDKRHVETLARQNYNWVKIKENDGSGKYIPGDIVNYNVLKNADAQSAKRVAVTPAIIGATLGQEVMHHTVGTVITPSVYESLKRYRIRELLVSTRPVAFDPVTRPMEQIPLLGSDWVARLGHRRLKDTLLQGATFNYASPINQNSPYANALYNQDPLDFSEVDY